ncbi:hypothetical protein CMI37_00500 [Candidatus Pacearchaeota archaeon]|nr:hypothetical protein [Candidatus Pacearchaeota archaeon]
MKNLTFFLGKIRPQIFLALCVLGAGMILGIQHDLNEIAVGCIAGIIALAKDVLQSDAGNGNGDGGTG